MRIIPIVMAGEKVEPEDPWSCSYFGWPWAAGQRQVWLGGCSWPWACRVSFLTYLIMYVIILSRTVKAPPLSWSPRCLWRQPWYTSHARSAPLSLSLPVPVRALRAHHPSHSHRYSMCLLTKNFKIFLYWQSTESHSHLSSHLPHCSRPVAESQPLLLCTASVRVTHPSPPLLMASHCWGSGSPG